METSEVLNSPPAAPTVADATDRPTTPSASPETSATEVLVTEQQVMFGTAAAAASRPKNQLMAALGRVFANSWAESRSRRQQRPRRDRYYIECARMGREMDRL